MTRIASLKPSADSNDRIVNAEANHEETRVSLRLSPRTTFILETMQYRLGRNRTRMVTELVEAAVLDWVEAQGIDPESDQFKDKYLAWLTREPEVVGPNGEEGYPLVIL